MYSKNKESEIENQKLTGQKRKFIISTTITIIALITFMMVGSIVLSTTHGMDSRSREEVIEYFEAFDEPDIIVNMINIDNLEIKQDYSHPQNNKTLYMEEGDDANASHTCLREKIVFDDTPDKTYSVLRIFDKEIVRDPDANVKFSAISYIGEYWFLSFTDSFYRLNKPTDADTFFIDGFTDPDENHITKLQNLVIGETTVHMYWLRYEMLSNIKHAVIGIVELDDNVLYKMEINFDSSTSAIEMILEDVEKYFYVQIESLESTK
jgi:hypothetical protein